MTDIRLQHFINEVKKLFATNIFASRYVHFVKPAIQHSFYLPQPVNFFWGDDRNRNAASSCPACPAASVCIHLHTVRKLVIDYMCDALYVNSPRGNVCRDQ